MKRLTTYIISVLYSLSVALAIVVMAPSLAQVQAAPAKSAKIQASVYNYVAQPGDSYSKMARKAIQTYGITNKVKLSHAQIIAAETWLTQDAGSPKLVKAQKVSINKDAVKAAAAKAIKLSKTQEARWNKYTSGVNFNTDAVGQAE